MSSWAGFTDEELSRLRQQNAGEQVSEGDGSGGRKKATINSAKRQRAREKIRTRPPSVDVKASLYKQEERADDHQRERRNSSTLNSKERSTSRLDSRDEESRENSSPECERRVKNKQILEEAPPKIKSTERKVEGPCESTSNESGVANEKSMIGDLPKIIDESEK